MPRPLKYVDKEGNVFLMHEADKQSAVEVYHFLMKWQKRYCYRHGFRLFLATSAASAPYDVINLSQPGISISWVKGETVKYHCLIEGCTTSAKKQYKLSFADRSMENWCKTLHDTVMMASLTRLKDIDPLPCPYKYICIPLLMDWLSLRDLIQLDSALCNSKLRRILLTLLKEYSSQFSSKFLQFSMSLKVKTANWLLQRGLTAKCIEFRNTALLNLLIDRDLYRFDLITDVVYESDTSLLYELLIRCPNLKSLLLYAIYDKHRFASTIIVHNRQLESFKWNMLRFEDRDALRIALHHPRFSVVSNLNLTSDGMFVFKCGLWHQPMPDSVQLRTSTAEQIEEVCKRSTSLQTLIDPESQCSLVQPLLDAQTQLQTVNLVLSFAPCLNIPYSLSRCSSILHLTLTRTGNNLIPLDWSCFSNSTMRLKSLHLSMAKEDCLKYFRDILSHAVSLSLVNDKMTDGEFLAILEANQNNLTSLRIYHANALSGDCMVYIREHCRSLKTLLIHHNVESFKRVHLQEYASSGSSSNITLQCLCVSSKMISIEAILLLAGNFPALRYLMLDCSNNALFKSDMHPILEALGSQLIELGLEFSSDDFKQSVRTIASGIAGCCQIV